MNGKIGFTCAYTPVPLIEAAGFSHPHQPLAPNIVPVTQQTKKIVMIGSFFIFNLI